MVHRSSHVTVLAAALAAFALAAAPSARAQDEPVTVWGLGSNDVWAVGATLGPLHFTGTTWEKASLGGTDIVALYAAWGSGPSDVFVGGGAVAGAIYHWDGRTWTPMTLPSRQTIVALLGRSATEVYALARTMIPGRTPSVLRWDGRAWTELPSPMPFYARGLALHGDEVLVVGDMDPRDARGADAAPGVLARLRAGQWTFEGRTPQGVSDATVAATRLRSVLVAGDSIYLFGTLADGKSRILTSTGGAWSEVPAPAADLQGISAKLAFVAGDGTLVALLGGAAGLAFRSASGWTDMRGPDPYSPPPNLSRDELLRQALAWDEVGAAQAAWGPTARDFFLLTGEGRIVRFTNGAPAIVYDASCADPDVAARSPVCRMLRRP